MSESTYSSAARPDELADVGESSRRSRRRLLQAVASGVPMMVSLPAVAGTAHGSAWGAVARDIDSQPVVSAAASGTWVQCAIQKVQVCNGNGACPSNTVLDAYRVKGVLYFPNGDVVPHQYQELSSSPFNAFVLFDWDGASLSQPEVWPKKQLGYAVHQSAWASMGGTGPACVA